MKYFNSFLRLLFCFFLTTSSTCYAADGSISGLALSNNPATGISDATITMTPEFGTGSPQSTTTDSGGKYTINNLPPGKYTFLSQPSTADQVLYAMYVTQITITSGNESINIFNMEKNPGEITGKVTADPGGSGLGASIAIAETISSTQVTFLTIQADAFGNYDIPSLAGGNYSLKASNTGYASQTLSATVTNGNNTPNIDFTLKANPSSITGTVTDADTTDPIEGVSVSTSNEGTPVTPVKTNASGVYTIEGLDASSHTVVASLDPTYETQTKTVQTSVGAESTQNFALTKNPGKITGTITANDGASTPLKGASAILRDKNNTIIKSTLTDSSGNYSMEGISAATYTMTASDTGYETKHAPVTVTAGGTVTSSFSLDAVPVEGTLSGTITDVDTGAGIPSALIKIWQGTHVLGSVRTSTDGSYQIQGLAVGTHTVEVSATDYKTDSSEITIYDTKTTIFSAQLSSGPSGTIFGTVQDTGLTVIPNASVTVTQSGIIFGQTITDSVGNYTLPGLEPGSYTTQVIVAGFESAVKPATVTTGTTEVNFTLTAGSGSTVTGTITDKITGAPIKGAIVIVTGITNGFLESAITDANGDYTIVGLFAGDFRLQATHSDYVDETNDTFTFTGPGETATENVELDPVDSPPQNVVGTVPVNQFLLYTDRIHKITFDAGITSSIASYQVYKNGKLARTYTGAGPFLFEDHNQSPLLIDRYVLYTVSTNGMKSSGVVVLLK